VYSKNFPSQDKKKKRFKNNWHKTCEARKIRDFFEVEKYFKKIFLGANRPPGKSKKIVSKKTNLA